MKTHCLIACIFLFLSFTATATHIIGGYMSYRHVTGQQFQIELVVYRDCFGGVPPFDDPASVAMYDAGGNYITTWALNLSYSVSVISSNLCTVSNLCIERASYLHNITLPAQSGAVTFVYQRCCRSLAITNLVDPGNTGISVSCTIDPAIINDSPVYDHEYASFTYSGDIFRFYASADDADGDSLVYSLDNAVAGASQADPMPQTPSAPPHPVIPWAPGYSQSNMLNGPVPVTIDPNSGLLYGVPGPAGYYVIACKTDEYRNGILIGSYRREFVVVVGVPTIIDIPGTAQVQGGSTPLDEGDAWLIKFNILDSTLFAVDTTDVTAGSFLHDDRINGLYLSKVSAKPTSNYYNDHLPTYYGDVLFWHQATVLTYCISVGITPDIDMVQGVNPGGPGFIGGFIADGANKIMSSSSSGGFAEGVTVILFNSLNQPVAYDVTDASGYFGIGNLQAGDYTVHIDRLGHYIDTMLAPVISVTAQQPNIDNQQFTLHNTWLEHLGTTGLEDFTYQDNELLVSPNPARSELWISLKNFQNHNAEYTILNSFGSIVLQGNLMDRTIQISHLQPQVYFLRIRTNDGVWVRRFVKI